MLSPYVDIGATLDRLCLIAGIGIVLLVIFVGVVAWMDSRKQSPPPRTYSQWETWMDTHEKTCPQCSQGPDGPMCMEAFGRLQEAIKRGDM